MPIYTRTGDDGTTALFGGKRVSKSDSLVDLYGSVDELNSWIGYVRSGWRESFLEHIQSDLMNLGGMLAGWSGDLRQIEKRISEMEHVIDDMDKILPELKNFILPGGSETATRLHIARSVCRRVERLAVKIQGNKILITYLNRLSDLLFTMARTVNIREGIAETAWSGIGKGGKT